MVTSQSLSQPSPSLDHTLMITGLTINPKEQRKQRRPKAARPGSPPTPFPRMIHEKPEKQVLRKRPKHGEHKWMRQLNTLESPENLLYDLLGNETQRTPSISFPSSPINRGRSNLCHTVHENVTMTTESNSHTPNNQIIPSIMLANQEYDNAFLYVPNDSPPSLSFPYIPKDTSLSSSFSYTPKDTSLSSSLPYTPKDTSLSSSFSYTPKDNSLFAKNHSSPTLSLPYLMKAERSLPKFNTVSSGFRRSASSIPTLPRISSTTNNKLSDIVHQRSRLFSDPLLQPIIRQ